MARLTGPAREKALNRRSLKERSGRGEVRVKKTHSVELGGLREFGSVSASPLGNFSSFLPEM